ncbi:NADP oxidoreductase [Thiomicrorhabdus sp.]|uniref:NADP oxidoreductase n=1 Tax=Thiomicrorhabdus sp. TaxID=2039724 RepID=UPI0035656858
MRLIVKSNQNLTPLCEDKAIYHIVLIPEPGERLEYQPGDWLTIQAANQMEWVEPLLECLGLTGDESIELRRVGSVSAREALHKHLEISQLNPAILNKLQRQYQLGDWADRQAMMDFAYGRDILDLLDAFPSLGSLGIEFLNLLSPLGPRYYSIASAMEAVGNEVHLVVKLVSYVNEHVSSRVHLGVASYAISRLSAGVEVEAEFKPTPTFQLPEESDIPIVMIGAGTGIAPFIGFMQHRAASDAKGDNFLFFGETHQACSFLFEDALTAWQAQDKLALFTAFSRDQQQKYYVQDRIWEQREVLWDLMQKGGHIYICGSQHGMAKDVTDTWTKIIETFAGIDRDAAQQMWQTWRKSKRLQMDVY